MADAAPAMGYTVPWKGIMKTQNSAAFFAMLGLAALCSSLAAQQIGQPTPTERLVVAVAKGIPCDGHVRVMPADQVGREFRGQCIGGIEIWAWSTPVAMNGPASESLLVIAINKTDALVTVARDGLSIVSLDSKHPDDAKRVQITRTVNPDKVSQWLARLGLAREAAEASTVFFPGGAISPGAAMSGIVYFGKIKGVKPMLMFAASASAPESDYIQIPINPGD